MEVVVVVMADVCMEVRGSVKGGQWRGVWSRAVMRNVADKRWKW